MTPWPESARDTNQDNKPELFTLLTQSGLAPWLEKGSCQTAVCTAFNHGLHSVSIARVAPDDRAPFLWQRDREKQRQNNYHKAIKMTVG